MDSIVHVSATHLKVGRPAAHIQSVSSRLGQVDRNFSVEFTIFALLDRGSVGGDGMAPVVKTPTSAPGATNATKPNINQSQGAQSVNEMMAGPASIIQGFRAVNSMLTLHRREGRVNSRELMTDALPTLTPSSGARSATFPGMEDGWKSRRPTTSRGPIEWASPLRRSMALHTPSVEVEGAST